ncbi:MAG: hypothetical protein M1812_003431 [Candelaria pacifica]|nr:MAG: hypothetical protein M1812_003431 [Candelaria pacifica]
MVAASLSALSHLSNPLATLEQLSTSGSQLDGVPVDLENSIRYAGAKLTQAAGILLQLPQDIIAQAVVVFTRFWLGTEGGSLKEYDAKDVSAACLYMMAKLSSFPQSPRNVLNCYAYLLSSSSHLTNASSKHTEPNPDSYYISEGVYLTQRARLFRTEAHILRVLGFQTHIALPYTLAINYLQALDVMALPNSSSLARQTFAHLTSALLSPQLLYLTHQPAALATASIYLAARELAVKLPSEEWWQVFDTDREELGFLVVGMKSMEGFASDEAEKWGKRNVPMTVDEVDSELESRKILDGGD